MENDAPNTVAGFYRTTVNTSFSDNALSNDTDAELDTLSNPLVASSFTRFGGIVTFAANGDFTYTPASGFTGIDYFEYAVSDGNGGVSTDYVEVSVTSTSSHDSSSPARALTIGISFSG